MKHRQARGLLVRLLVNTLAIYVAVELVSGLHFEQGPVRFLAVAATLGLVNAFVRPLFAFLTCPLVMVTLGLFMLVINALMLRLTAWISGLLDLGFYVDGFWPAFWGGLIIGIVSTILTIAVGGDGNVQVRVERH
jgi:putative membrane protein